jgi:superfamily I DNA/RNA helicase
MPLTPSQQMAVDYDRHLILFAGPGSGKTATSVAKGRRILQLGDSHLGMVTFTTAGAGEMRERMEASFAATGGSLPKHRFTTGTFHSLALRHYQRHGRSTRKLISPPARSGLLAGMLSHLDFEARSAYALELDRYQGALNPEEVELESEVETFVHTYLQRLKAMNAMDLSMVMRDCVMGMRSGSIPLFPLTHLIGDEMQDADQVQLELMIIHAKAEITTTLVGDDDQTIYEWRNAMGYEGLMRFAKETGAKTITLAENFRSLDSIVAHSQILIEHNNPKRIDKSPRAVRGTGGLIGFTSAARTEAACESIANAIQAYRVDGESVAVLGRSNRDLDFMEQLLLQATDENGNASPIPYQRDGQSMWQTPEVATLTSFLSALLHGQTVDLASTLSLLQLSATTRSSLERALGSTCGRFLDGQMVDVKTESKEEAQEIKSFVGATSFARARLRSGELAFAIRESVNEVSRLLKGQPKARPKLVDSLFGSAESVLVGLRGSLSQRLNIVGRANNKEPHEGAVRLLTMHSSKGLEFDLVFLLNANDPEDGSTLIDDHPERRLFYVAMTRAKNRLAVVYCNKPIKYISEARLPYFPTLDALFTV